MVGRTTIYHAKVSGNNLSTPARPRLTAIDRHNSGQHSVFPTAANSAHIADLGRPGPVKYTTPGSPEA